MSCKGVSCGKGPQMLGAGPKGLIAEKFKAGDGQGAHRFGNFVRATGNMLKGMGGPRLHVPQHLQDVVDGYRAKGAQLMGSLGSRRLGDFQSSGGDDVKTSRSTSFDSKGS